jgi:hypothetical protein
MSGSVLGSNIRNAHLASSGFARSEETANVFAARFAGLQMNVEYFQHLFIERVICQSDKVIKIEVLVSEPELRFETEVEWSGTSLLF